MSTWATKIIDLEAAGFSHREIGDHCGLSVSSVSDIKTGRTKQPRADAALKLVEMHAARDQRAPVKPADLDQAAA